MNPTIGALDVAVGAGVLTAAALALTARNRLVSAVAFLVFGTLLAVVWALLQAPDVALAEAVLGAGVTGALLIDAASRRPSRGGSRRAESPGEPPGARGAAPTAARPTPRARSWARRGGAAVLLTVPPAAALSWSFGRPGAAGEEPARRVLEAAPASGVDHPVTAVLLAFRAYDTLLEIAVLVGAAVVVNALGGSSPDASEASDAPVAQRGWNLLEVYVRVLGGLLVLVACWYLAAGSSRPGGAFQAGALLAGVLIVVHAAGLRRLEPGSRLVRGCLVAGLAAFLAVAALGPLTGGRHWLALEPGAAGTLILALEAVLTISIGVALAVMFVALAQGTAAQGRAAQGRAR